MKPITGHADVPHDRYCKQVRECVTSRVRVNQSYSPYGQHDIRNLCSKTKCCIVTPNKVQRWQRHDIYRS